MKQTERTKTGEKAESPKTEQRERNDNSKEGKERILKIRRANEHRK